MKYYTHSISDQLSTKYMAVGTLTANKAGIIISICFVGI